MASDPIGFELFKNSLLSIADEMALTILRTAYSGVLTDNMDYSPAFCDGEGRTVTQGLTLPAHLSSFPDALAATLARYGDRMQPGDVYCLNDPFEGGMHIPDVFVLKPIFHEGRRLAFAATICHQTDMGGRVAGSNASDSTEIYQEGLDRKSTRLNSSHVKISYAVFCLKKKKRNVRWFHYSNHGADFGRVLAALEVPDATR